MRRVVILLIVCLFAAPAFGWGEKGHYIVNEAATYALPTDMPPFFYQAFPELIFLAYDPDRWRGAGESLDAANLPDHFLDYEYVAQLDLPRDRDKYLTLLESSGTLRRHGISNSTPGTLPWRIAELSEQLQNEWRQWRFSQPGSAERAFIEHDIIHIAGILGHFAGDASNPHHATWNFNGWVDPNPNGYATDCGTHARFETNFVSHAIETKDVTPKVAPPVLRTDYFRTALDFIKQSNAQVETLYRIDRDGGFDLFRRPPSPEGVAFASSRIAAGSSLLRDLWWSTWKNSAKAPPRRNAED